MEIMEDGNLMDKVLILIQRDMEYYTKKQTVLQETICPGIVGGRLDFPRSASFAAVKLVLWWEEEFLAAYRKPSGFMQDDLGTSEKLLATTGGCGGIVKASDPAKFITLITKSSDELLDHLHVLTQEALDHADLTVLTGTIGAAALLKNCLWYYTQNTTEDSKEIDADQLVKSQKKYQDMGEALAERLLDLHCRLLSLYILQDAESLDWENVKPFCESERGSYVIQMWWLYMQGTKEDLWNTVPPKMAQRVFSGMLNESLTILTVRYSQAKPSENRATLYSADISNLLLCVSKLLPSICNNSEEFIGANLNSHNKMLRDIHSKCQELLTCLLLRGCPLDVLYKVFRKGLDKIDIFKPKKSGPSPWIVFTLTHLFHDFFKADNVPYKLSLTTELVLELSVLLPQPQPNWALLLKVICMKDCKIAKILLKTGISEYKKHCESHRSSITLKAKCGGFLCSGDGTCKGVDMNTPKLTSHHYYDIVYSITYVILVCGNESDFERILLNEVAKGENDWFQCFDRRQVWNQIRPAWFVAITDLIQPFLLPVIQEVVSAVKTGASMYQASSIVLESFYQLWECVNPAFTKISDLIQDLLPATITPIGNSVLLHFIISAMYTQLLNFEETKVKFSPGKADSEVGVALSIGEALCGIDEDNKHTREIEKLLEESKNCEGVGLEGCGRVEENLQMLEVLVSDLLLTDQGKKSLKVIDHFVKNNHEWLMREIQGNNNQGILPNTVNKEKDKLLHVMFYIGERPFDELLTGKWIPNWLEMFNVPMGLSTERVYSQVSSRWEFCDPNFANKRYGHIITYINTLLKQSYNLQMN